MDTKRKDVYETFSSEEVRRERLETRKITEANIAKEDVGDMMVVIMIVPDDGKLEYRRVR